MTSIFKTTKSPEKNRKGRAKVFARNKNKKTKLNRLEYLPTVEDSHLKLGIRGYEPGVEQSCTFGRSSSRLSKRRS